VGLARATYYRRVDPVYGPPVARPSPPRTLSKVERAAVLAVLHEDRFVDLSPTEVHATLLDEGRHLCSERTMFRILAENKEVRERRNQLRHPVYAAPELLATKPNQLWSWDITKLKGPEKWTYFYLYVILDVYSRYVVGWMVATRESQVLAKKLIAASCKDQAIEPDTLTLHADRGSSMKSKSVAFLLADLGVTKTHSRPHVSNDNPYSEAFFKTFKYRPGCPKRFGCEQDARGFSADLFEWYNHDHHHSGLAMLTPHDVHYGHVEARVQARQRALDAAFLAHPERFPNGPPAAGRPDGQVWINKPKPPATGAPVAVASSDRTRDAGGVTVAPASQELRH
jgi:putative transposase